MWKEAKAADGRVYYYHTQTRETKWTKPEDFDAQQAQTEPKHDQSAVDAAWKETRAEDGRTYYYNSITLKTSWQKPVGMVSATQQAPRATAPPFASSGTQDLSERRYDHRDSVRDQGLPHKSGFDGGRPEGGRPGGGPWESRNDNSGFRGPMPSKTDEPEYGTLEQAEEAFFKLLRRHKIQYDAPWQDALRVVAREKDYRALKDPRDRRQAYERYCIEEQALERGRIQERKERLREEFRAMLKTHADITHYTRWKTARPIIEREVVFKTAGDDETRKQMFHEYIAELQRKHFDSELTRRGKALDELSALMRVLIVAPTTKWSEALEAIEQNERFVNDETFRPLTKADLLRVFELHIKESDQETNEAKQSYKRHRYRHEREARDGFKALLQEHSARGHITAGTKWQDFHSKIADDARYRGLLGVSGSGPLDLFWDMVEDEERRLRSKRNDALDVLEDQRFEMMPDTQLEEFKSIMRHDPRTAGLSSEDLELVYKRLIDKVKKRQKDDKLLAERDEQMAVEALRSAIKHLDPPVRVDDTYQEVAKRLEGSAEFRALDDDARHTAFDKHIRRLQEKSDDRERDRARRDRERDHRNGSRRSYDHERDRDRDRSRRTHTPEIDAYEADRRKAQADRERQYRKASFGLTPPPRDRRDDRFDRERDRDRDRRADRYESVYERERREREAERERSYVSRADPRDRGKGGALDYGDEDAVGSHPGSVRKRRDSDASSASRRDVKRSRRDGRVEPDAEAMVVDKEEPALQSGSEEGEIEEV